jgi:hypothetical protein
MAMVGLVATVIVDVSGIDSPDMRAFTAAVLAIAASDVVKYLATRAWKKFFNEVGDERNELQRKLSTRNIMDDIESRRLDAEGRE